jgi:hypothetical protein
MLSIAATLYELTEPRARNPPLLPNLEGRYLMLTTHPPRRSNANLQDLGSLFEGENIGHS